ncbi:glycerate kinase [soil metagenome]
MTTRDKAIQIFNSAIAAVHPAQLMPAHLFIKDNTLHIFNQQFSLAALQNIYVIGAGKASAAMAKSVEDILGNLITAGIIVTKYQHSISLQKIACAEAAHPVPDEEGVVATKQTIELLQRAGKNDLIICLISGGASALWMDVPEGLTLKDLQITYELLLTCGAAINEMNTVRKHLSAVKGGQLLQYAPLASWFTFIISDVPGDNLSVIASGPTVADDSTFADAECILKQYHLLDQLPAAISDHIYAGVKGKIKETARPTEPVFNQVHNQIIGSNSIALKAAATCAGALGYSVAVAAGGLEGDAEKEGAALLNQCRNYTGTLPACWLRGGETTVTVMGNGKGGRNQQMALSAQLELNKNANDGNHAITFLAAGTDGTDGPTDAAGAIADRASLELAKKRQLNAAAFLKNNDAYHFFEQTDSLFKTGPTQTNVMDLVVVIADSFNG